MVARLAAVSSMVRRLRLVRALGPSRSRTILNIHYLYNIYRRYRLSNFAAGFLIEML